jgi:hypothetical protein
MARCSGADHRILTSNRVSLLITDIGMPGLVVSNWPSGRKPCSPASKSLPLWISVDGARGFGTVYSAVLKKPLRLDDLVKPRLAAVCTEVVATAQQTESPALIGGGGDKHHDGTLLHLSPGPVRGPPSDMAAELSPVTIPAGLFISAVCMDGDLKRPGRPITCHSA